MFRGMRNTPRFQRLFGPGAACVLAGALLVAGCSSNKSQFVSISAPQPPAFLNGPMALLLTNSSGFRAHVVLETSTPVKRVAEGTLLGKGTRLLFAPTLTKEGKKKPLLGGFAFIWNVDGNQGYLLNDPLQAYSPYSSSLQFTNVSLGAAAGAAAQSMGGHSCQPGEAIVAGADGSLAAFRLWRAKDLNGLPLRIVCTSGATPLTLNLIKPRLEKLSDELFLPSTDFTKYDSPEALANELALRQNSLKRRPSSALNDTEPAWDARVPSRP